MFTCANVLWLLLLARTTEPLPGSSSTVLQSADGITPVVVFIGRQAPRPLEELSRQVNADVTINDLMFASLRFYLDRIESRIGRHVELRALPIQAEDFDAECTAYREALAALRDGTDPAHPVVCIVDSTWGKHVTALQSAIRSSALPYIQVNGDKLDADTGPYSLFIGQDDETPLMLASLMRRPDCVPPGHEEAVGADARMAVALDEGRSLLIVEDEADFPLSQEFMRLFVADDSDTPVRGILFLPRKPAGDAQLEEWARACTEKVRSYADWYCRETEPHKESLVVLNTHDGKASITGTKVAMRALNALGVTSCTVLGGPYIYANIDEETVAEFLARGNRIILGTYPEDSLSTAVADGLANLRRHHERSWSANDYLFVKRSLEACSLIEACLLDRTFETEATEHTPPLQKLQRGFAHVRRTGSVETRAGLLNFSSKGTRIQSPKFELIDQHGRHSLPFQLRLAAKEGQARWDLVPNIGIGIQLEAVRQLDLENNTFVADIYYTLRAPSACMDVGTGQEGLDLDEVAKSIYFRNLIEVRSSQHLGRVNTPEMGFSLFRLCGVFAGDFDPLLYPFDGQRIPIELAVSRGAHDVVVSVEQTSIGEPLGGESSMRTPNWDVVSRSMAVGQTLFSYEKYDPSIYIGRGASAREHPSIVLSTQLSRRLTKTMWCVGIMAILLSVCWVLLARAVDMTDENRLAVTFGAIGLLGALIGLYIQERPSVSSGMVLDGVVLTMSVFSAFLVARANRTTFTLWPRARPEVARAEAPLPTALDRPEPDVAHGRPSSQQPMKQAAKRGKAKKQKKPG